MGWTLIASAENVLDAAGATMDTTTSLTVAAGDLLVGAFKHEGAADVISCASVSGSPPNTFTFDVGDYASHVNGDLHGTYGYVLSAAADAAATFRMTDSASRPYRGMIIWQFRPDVGDVVSKDGSNIGQGSDANPTSGTMTTTGTDVVAIGMYAQYNAEPLLTREINNVSADGFEDALASVFSSWYRLLTAPMTSAAADATKSGVASWLCDIIAFKAAPASVPLINMDTSKFPLLKLANGLRGRSR